MEGGSDEESSSSSEASEQEDQDADQDVEMADADASDEVQLVVDSDEEAAEAEAAPPRCDAAIAAEWSGCGVGLFTSMDLPVPLLHAQLGACSGTMMLDLHAC